VLARRGLAYAVKKSSQPPFEGVWKQSAAPMDRSMRRLLCMLVGHRYLSPRVVVGISVVRCARCDHAKPFS
jgi:hypothetical protein